MGLNSILVSFGLTNCPSLNNCTCAPGYSGPALIAGSNSNRKKYCLRRSCNSTKDELAFCEDATRYPGATCTVQCKSNTALPFTTASYVCDGETGEFVNQDLACSGIAGLQN